jgi:dynactin complex subunit
MEHLVVQLAQVQNTSEMQDHHTLVMLQQQHSIRRFEFLEEKQYVSGLLGPGKMERRNNKH